VAEAEEAEDIMKNPAVIFFRYGIAALAAAQADTEKIQVFQ
jgi:hypothetical protein